MKMKNFTRTALAAAIALCLPALSLAGMTKAEHESAKKSIEVDYKAAKSACEPLAGNTKDVCVAQAKGQEKVARAELQATYKPSADSRYEARLARAQADFTVAKEKCDDKGGNAKDVCVKEAEAAQTAAKADAKAQMKTADASKDAGKKITAARADAASDKRDAEYAVEKEKCDALASSAKDTCIGAAKARYGKS